MNALAIAVVRDGHLPIGADEACAEAGGSIILFGTNLADVHVPGATLVSRVPMDTVDARRIVEHVASMVEGLGSDLVLILPASPDGRDLAPRLAHRLGLPLYAGATRINQSRVTVVRTAGRVQEDIRPDRSFVATLIPGVRGVEMLGTPTASGQPDRGLTNANGAANTHHPADAPDVSDNPSTMTEPAVATDITSLEILPADPSTMDLAEADRIVAGGQGLGTKEQFDLLAEIGTALGASLGGTRVASDAGWIPFARQIGTTGVAVDPSLYLAFAISGATQHTTGLGSPDHIISVNTDPSCPMMAMADLAINADANEVIRELHRRLTSGDNHS